MQDIDETGSPETGEAIAAEPLFGERIRALRVAREWSQEDVAQRMARAGFSWRQTTVAKTEKADRPIRVNEAVVLANMFAADLCDLVKPEVHPLAERLQQATSVLAAVEQELRDHRQRVADAERLHTFSQRRVRSLLVLLAYSRDPTRENLIAAVYEAYPWLADDERQSVFADAGIPPETFAAAEQLVDETFGGADATARRADRRGDETLTEQIGRHVALALADLIAGGDGRGEHQAAT